MSGTEVTAVEAELGERAVLLRPVRDRALIRVMVEAKRSPPRRRYGPAGAVLTERQGRRASPQKNLMSPS